MFGHRNGRSVQAIVPAFDFARDRLRQVRQLLPLRLARGGEFLVETLPSLGDQNRAAVLLLNERRLRCGHLIRNGGRGRLIRGDKLDPRGGQLLGVVGECRGQAVLQGLIEHLLLPRERRCPPIAQRFE